MQKKLLLRKHLYFRDKETVRQTDLIVEYHKIPFIVLLNNEF